MNPNDIDQNYKYGFSTDIDQDLIPKGINEEVIRLISTKKNEPQWLLDFRLKGYQKWLEQHQQGQQPTWADLNIQPIDYQDIIYFAGVKKSAQTKTLAEYKKDWLDELNDSN
jgi:Fe-S cluster assembly protein SufB